jgi:hypothetical protein
MKLKKIKGNSWHPTVNILNDDNEIICTLNENPSGCGSMILTGWVYSDPLMLKKAMSELIEKLKSNSFNFNSDEVFNIKLDIGAITTVAGQNFYGDDIHPSLNILIELGFKEVSEYNNPRHGNYKQKLYIWTAN